MSRALSPAELHRHGDSSPCGRQGRGEYKPPERRRATPGEQAKKVGFVWEARSQFGRGREEETATSPSVPLMKCAAVSITVILRNSYTASRCVPDGFLR